VLHAIVNSQSHTLYSSQHFAALALTTIDFPGSRVTSDPELSYLLAYSTIKTVITRLESQFVLYANTDLEVVIDS
jgi:hypothetical protein